MTRGAIALGLALTLSLAPAAAAKPPTPEARDAGRVHELVVMIESVTLRCRLVGMDLLPKFRAFTARQKQGLVRAEDALKRHFGVVVKADMNREIDRFTIRTYNFYGTGRTDQQTCDSFAKLMDLLAETDAGSDLLTSIAEIMVPEPMLDTHP